MSAKQSSLAKEKVKVSLNTLQIRTIALQIVGAYIMNHVADVMEMLQDKHGDELDEKTLITIEVQVKTIAEELSQQSRVPS